MLLVLIFTAVFIPSIFGCCFPDQFSGTGLVVEKNMGVMFVIDHNQKKFISRPMRGPVEFVLSDFANHKVYTKRKDGSCTKADLPRTKSFFEKCTPNNTVLGQFNLGPQEALAIQSHRFRHGNKDMIIATTVDKCLPVISVVKKSGKTKTTIFADVTDTSPNVDDLNQDISGCAEKA